LAGAAGNGCTEARIIGAANAASKSKRGCGVMVNVPFVALPACAPAVRVRRTQYYRKTANAARRTITLAKPRSRCLGPGGVVRLRRWIARRGDERSSLILAAIAPNRSLDDLIRRRRRSEALKIKN
jgi:hypothetical protein